MRHLTLMIKIDQLALVLNIQREFRHFDQIVPIEQSDSTICRWFQVEESFAERVFKFSFKEPLIRSFILSQYEAP